MVRNSLLGSSIVQGLPGAAVRVLGSPAVARVACTVIGGRLPVLAYHDVTDPDVFAAHLDTIQTYFRPVSGEEVAFAVDGRRQLPRGAIWVTFDDAHPGVIENALPLLLARGIPATLFVCPGVIDTDRPYWWQVIDHAIAADSPIHLDGMPWLDRSVITQLKRVPDGTRREAVARAEEELARSGQRLAVRQTTSTSLRKWLQAGLGVGNHTWDHPCLDTCDAAEQRRQVMEAHEWLRGVLDTSTHLFAYPNGNTSQVSRRVLAQQGYTVAALFDHRVSRVRGAEVSRLRVDAQAPVHRLRAIASGAHPAAFAVARRLGVARDTTGAQR